MPEGEDFRLIRSDVGNVQEDVDSQVVDVAIDDLSRMMRSFANTVKGSDQACFRQVVEAIPDAVIIHRNGRIIYANPAAGTSMIGKAPEALIGRRVFDFVAPEDRDHLGEAIHAVMAHGGTSEIVPYVRVGADGPAAQY